MVFEKNYIKRIHVNQHNIRKNNKTGEDLPCITLKYKGKSYYGYDVEIHGITRVVQPKDKALSCGARVWVETTDKVVLKQKREV